MKVWKPPVANADRKVGNVLAESLLREIRSVPSLLALDDFESEWVLSGHRRYPPQWLSMVQEECADRRADLTAMAKEASMDRQFQYAMDKDD